MVYRINKPLTEEDRKAWKRAASRRKRITRKARGAIVKGWLAMKLASLFTMTYGGFVIYAVVKSGMQALMGGFLALLGLALVILGSWIFRLAPPLSAMPPRLPETDFPPARPPEEPVCAAFFGDGYFSFRGPSGWTRVSYQSITEIWEDGRCFYLFLEAYPPLVLPRRGFARCMPEDFRDFITKMTGEECGRI